MADAASTVVDGTPLRTSQRDAVTPAPQAKNAAVVHPQLAEALRKADYWERKYSDSEKALRALQDEASELVQRESEAVAQYALSMAAHDRLFKKYSSLSRRHGQLHEQLDRSQEKSQREIEALKKKEETHEETKKKLNMLRSDKDEILRELQHLRVVHRDMESLLETRTVELRDAEAYLAKTDKRSYADVQRMVEGLNAQIFQLAALVTDSFDFIPKDGHANNLRDAFQQVERRIGHPFANLLLSSSHDDDPIWVQMALQATATLFTSFIIDAWDIRFDKNRNSFLTSIYRGLYEEGQYAQSIQMM